MDRSDFFNTVEPRVQNFVNYFSLVSASLMIFFVIVITLIQKDLLNRVTFRFQAAIALLDIFRHTLIVYQFTDNDGWCTFIGFFTFFGNQFYVLLNVAIAFNIHRVYLRDIQPKKIDQFIYWYLAIVIALIIDTIPLGLSMYGRDTKELCLLKYNGVNRVLLKIFLVYLGLVPGMIYCLINFVSISLNLRRKTMEAELKRFQKGSIRSGAEERAISYMKKITFRVALYPVSCLVTLGFYIVAHLIYDMGSELSDPVYFLSRLGLRSAGTFNLLCFLIDPGLARAIKKIVVISRAFFKRVRFRILNKGRAIHPESITPPAPDDMVAVADSNISTNEDASDSEVDSRASTLWEDTRIAFGEWIRFL